MYRRVSEVPLASVMIALVIAFVLAPVVRSVTTELTLSIGQLWPFSLEPCPAKRNPGCSLPPATLAIKDSRPIHWATR